MKCPFCGEENTRVIDTRAAEDDRCSRRRRQCDACGKRFTTYEKVESIPIMVVKKDRTREPYDRAKIEQGIIRSCNKRPVSMDKIIATVDAIDAVIEGMGQREIESAKIGELVMDHIKTLDGVAYVRFASVYREFKDVNTFMDELKKVLK